MHSPFIFELITKVMNHKTDYPSYARVESMRKNLKGNHSKIDVLDLGAGSSFGGSKTRTISSIAAHAAKPAKYGQLLHRIAKYYHCKNILELGTSLGISTSYLALSNPEASVTTIEGSPEIAAKARENFSSLGIENIEVVEGNFDNVLEGVLSKMGRIDLAYIDGNHRLEPTLKYFEIILPYTHNDTILIFDDIHWSGEMEKAWKTITDHAAVRASVDFFFIGVVFLRREFKVKRTFRVFYR